ncbi:MAG: MYXO-CTERM sorting domain-containing protein [Myxococcales bacterium]|nr:MYXO-CTERM sorting domain-containing protein [Myxococcales bacterium]
MWWLALTSAWAAPAGDVTSTCAPGQLTEVRPADGAIVGPDVVVMAGFTGNCGIPAFQVVDDAAYTVQAELGVRDQVITYTPLSPLDPGTYTVMSWDYYTGVEQELSTFTVEAGADPVADPPAPVSLTVDAERSCVGGLSAFVTGTLTMPTDPTGWAVISLTVSTENGAQSTVTELWAGEPTIELRTTVFGGREVCVVATIENAAGDIVHTTDRTCAEAFDGCPDDTGLQGNAEEDPSGCGCATGGDGGWTLAGLALALLRRRRR